MSKSRGIPAELNKSKERRHSSLTVAGRERIAGTGKTTMTDKPRTGLHLREVKEHHSGK